MRISTDNIVDACLSAAFLAACSGCGPSSSTPMSVAPQIAAPLSQSPAGRSTALRVTTAERTRARPGYSVLYSFIGGSGDGGYPIGDLLNVNGTLYGTTAGQGAHGVGTVFAITVSGKETVLYSFGTNSEDGTNPIAGLINVNGTLYGTTENGGSNGYGTVFAITMSGKETVLYSFGTSSEDGTSPCAGLIDVNGTLYGTTVAGGVNCRSGSSGCGTVFAITTSGKETVLHSFGGSGDGDGPVAERFSRSRRPGRKPCCIASGARETAQIPLPALSTSTACYTARPVAGARRATERSSQSRCPVRKPSSTASALARKTAITRLQA